MLPKTTPEQRARFYDDVESLLSPGFLSHRVEIEGVRLQIRSLGPGDVFMLRSRAEGGVTAEWRKWALATAIWMADGRSLLGKDDAVPFMYDFLGRLPRGTQEILFTILLGLFARAGRATDAIEAYCLETTSRFRWKTYGTHIQTASGVPGAEILGLNLVQRIWVAFNEVEDQHHAEETAWEGFKLVASSNAPKAVKKLDARDSARRQEDVEKRQKQLDHFYYRSLKVIDDKGIVIGSDDLRVSGPKSVEDLEDEMRRWVTGDQDQHDRVIADYKARIIAKTEAERAEREARRLALESQRRQVEEAGIDWVPQPIMGLTLEQLHAMLATRPQARPGVSFVHTGPPGGARNYVYEKYLKGQETPGQLAVAEDKVMDPTADPDADQRTLGELIRQRQVAFKAGE